MKNKLVVHIIAGSNGAGKTTFAREFLPKYIGTVDFINADLIFQQIKQKANNCEK